MNNIVESALPQPPLQAEEILTAPRDEMAELGQPAHLKGSLPIAQLQVASNI
jgi:hypothetical protein